MVEKSELQNAFVRRTFLSGAVWLPIVLGGAMMVVASGIPFWLGVGAVGCGVGTAIWRFTLGRKKIEDAIVAQFRKEADRQHHSFLRALGRKLRRDRDPNTGRLLRTLQDMHKRMTRAKIFTKEDGEQTWQVQVHEHMTKLYESSVGSLERSFQIWQSAEKVRDDKLKSELTESRSRLLEEVTESVGRLATALDQMQFSSMKNEDAETELSSLREELEQGLLVATAVEERINALNRQVRKATRSSAENS
ncbi:MAG: hypothetical protein KDB27_01775 [Planctomycetales bacterium]|nr:hypothetical protein [Planctomycetales bacterium]